MSRDSSWSKYASPLPCGLTHFPERVCPAASTWAVDVDLLVHLHGACSTSSPTPPPSRPVSGLTNCMPIFVHSQLTPSTVPLISGIDESTQHPRHSVHPFHDGRIRVNRLVELFGRTTLVVSDFPLQLTNLQCLVVVPTSMNLLGASVMLSLFCSGEPSKTVSAKLSPHWPTVGAQHEILTRTLRWCVSPKHFRLTGLRAVLYDHVSVRVQLHWSPHAAHHQLHCFFLPLVLSPCSSDIHQMKTSSGNRWQPKHTHDNGTPPCS